MRAPRTDGPRGELLDAMAELTNLTNEVWQVFGALNCSAETVTDLLHWVEAANAQLRTGLMPDPADMIERVADALQSPTTNDATDHAIGCVLPSGHDGDCDVPPRCGSCGQTVEACEKEKDDMAEWNDRGSCEFGPDCDGTRCGAKGGDA